MRQNRIVEIADIRVPAERAKLLDWLEKLASSDAFSGAEVVFKLEVVRDAQRKPETAKAPTTAHR